MVKIIDATKLRVGRLATYVAHQALLGEKIILINCEKAVISGTRGYIIEHYKFEIDERGGATHGPYYPRQPHLIVRRAIRGMLPYQTDRGKKAYARITCFMGVPKQYANQKIETVESASASKLSSGKYLSIKQIASEIGYKHG